MSSLQEKYRQWQMANQLHPATEVTAPVMKLQQEPTVYYAWPKGVGMFGYSLTKPKFMPSVKVKAVQNEGDESFHLVDTDGEVLVDKFYPDGK
jgi:hypothetical protein